jgi:hypothetical protein
LYVNRGEKELAALTAPIITMHFAYLYTQSAIKTLAVGLASIVAGFFTSVYFDSTFNSQLMSDELRRKKEDSKVLYENFLAKMNSMS